MLRRVKIFGYVDSQKVVTGIGEFHQFGVDWEEVGNTAVNFTTGIVERPDGTVQNLPLDMFRFIVEDVNV